MFAGDDERREIMTKVKIKMRAAIKKKKLFNNWSSAKKLKQTTKFS